MENAYLKAMKSENKEEALLNFIENSIGIVGIVLAKIESDGSITLKTLDANHKIKDNTCN